MVQYDLFVGLAAGARKTGLCATGHGQPATNAGPASLPACKGDDVNRVTPLSDPEHIDLRHAIWRGVRRCCPHCGRGALFKSYLKQVDVCAICHETYAHIRADDAPPWLTILVVGHIVVPLIFIVNSWFIWPNWLVMLVWPIITAALALTILPRAKGVFIAIIWATRAPGSEHR